MPSMPNNWAIRNERCLTVDAAAERREKRPEGISPFRSLQERSLPPGEGGIATAAITVRVLRTSNNARPIHACFL
jgi:hypothetical protein